MYRPNLRPGEDLVRSSPGVTVKNVPFDAFLTSKRIIFIRNTDDLQERKELVFPLNLVNDFKPSSDESGTPDIRFSIEKPSGEVGDLILRFIQTGDYRYSERDEWIESLRALSEGDIPVRNRQDNLFSEEMPAAVRPPVPEEPPQTIPRGMGEIPAPSAGIGYGAPSTGSARPQAAAPPSPREASSGSAPTRFCRFCGSKVPQGSAFCPSCGGKLEEKSERQMDFSQPPAAAQAPPLVQTGGSGFVAPPPPPPPSGHGGYGRQPGQPSGDGGISLAGERASGYGAGGQQMPPRNQKAMMKDQAKAEKAYRKEQERAEKEQRKAMKKAGKGGYNDPYGYNESRIPEGLPKVILIAVVAIVVVAVAGYAFTNGLVGGGGDTSAASSGDSQSSSSSSGTTTSGSDSTTASTSYGNWFFEVLYSGDWSGTYKYNGQTYSISGFGYEKSPSITNPSGTIEISITKDDGESGKIMEVSLYNSKSVPVESGTSSTSAGETVTINYSVS